MKKNRYQQAYRSFCRLRNSEIQAARELYSAHIQILLERTAFEGKTLGARIWELFAIPRLRRATFASAWIVISQQFSGVSEMCCKSGFGAQSKHVTDQHHGLLLLDYICRRRVQRYSIASGILWVWFGDFCFRFPSNIQ